MDFTKVARALGGDWNYESPSEIMDEIASLAPLYSQATYDRLEGWNSLCWGSMMVAIHRYYMCMDLTSG